MTRLNKLENYFSDLQVLGTTMTQSNKFDDLNERFARLGTKA
jgi:hypothetical protein